MHVGLSRMFSMFANVLECSISEDLLPRMNHPLFHYFCPYYYTTLPRLYNNTSQQDTSIHPRRIKTPPCRPNFNSLYLIQYLFSFNSNTTTILLLTISLLPCIYFHTLSVFNTLSNGSIRFSSLFPSVFILFLSKLDHLFRLNLLFLFVFCFSSFFVFSLSITVSALLLTRWNESFSMRGRM